MKTARLRLLRSAGTAVLAAAALVALAAPAIAPHAADERFTELLNAPPTRVRVRDAGGQWQRPFIYPWARVSQIEQRYEENRSRVIPLAWFSRGRLVTSSDDETPLMWLGADRLGRDVFSRLLHGARVSLGLAVVAALGAMVLGSTLGALAGYAGGVADDLLMRGSDLVLVLPAMYVALALRSAMPLVLSPATVFVLLSGIFAVLGAPFFSRGVRATIRAERGREYVSAAASLGAGPLRILFRHLLPASAGFIAVELTMLAPAFIVAEATLSYVGLGFPDPIPTWGTMLQEGSNVRAFVDFPWLLSPAAAMFMVVLAFNLVVQGTGRGSHLDRPL
jgi:peptide/nickel transport system permease protein